MNGRKKMSTIGIRTDGGPSIGMGHIMRCLSLAKEFRRQGQKVYFISKFKNGIDRIQQEAFEIIPLTYNQSLATDAFDYGSINELQQETGEIIQAIKKYNIELLLIDSYNVIEEYFLNLKPYIRKLMYIDDINRFVYPVDILINGNITAPYMDYKKHSPDEVMLLGPKYNLIREEFRNLSSRTIKKEVKETMITTGGSDPYNVSSKIVNILLEDEELKQLKINIVVGIGFRNKEELREISKSNSNVILHENIRDMSKIMLSSDIAISSGGSTLYELCACGTPTISFIVAENQREIVEKMQELGYVISLGWYNEFSKKRFVNDVKKICCAYEKRARMSKNMQKLLDGEGTKRIVKKILSQLKK